MGFLQGIADIGKLDSKSGLESYLKFPLEKGGRIIRVWLKVKDIQAECLEVQSISRIDVAEQLNDEKMKRKYLYRDKVGANVTWGFTPLHKTGKPKSSREANAKEWLGTDQDWKNNKKSHLYKIYHRVLKDYENEGIINAGATDLITDQLNKNMDTILDIFQGKDSFVILFGADSNDGFVYPGEIPAFVSYFNNKLHQTLPKTQSDENAVCSLCNMKTSDKFELAKVFKFATLDKVNFIPGLNSKRAKTGFTICRTCLEGILAGRERVDRKLSLTGVIPGLRLWIIPEAIGPKSSQAVEKAVQQLERLQDESQVPTAGEKAEGRFFRNMAKSGHNLVYHFIFWERNNAQELIHLMVEDVPPERLAVLEKKWEKAFKSVFGSDVAQGLNLDWAIKSLYATLSRFAGKSEADKLVFRDLALKMLGKMLRGETLPLATFKQVIVSRSARLIFENDNWDEVKRSIKYAQVWCEYISLINRR